MKKILIVDDDEDDRLMINQAIKDCNDSVEVSECNDGCYVLQYLEDNYPSLPDLIILDLNMPTRNGFEVIIELQANKKFSAIPIYIFTTSSYGRDKIHSLQLGATDVLIKPPAFEHWVKTLCAIVDKKEVIS